MLEVSSINLALALGYAGAARAKFAAEHSMSASVMSLRSLVMSLVSGNLGIYHWNNQWDNDEFGRVGGNPGENDIWWMANMVISYDHTSQCCTG